MRESKVLCDDISFAQRFAEKLNQALCDDLRPSSSDIGVVELEVLRKAQAKGLKKYVSGDSQKAKARSAAVEKFLSVQQHLEPFNRDFHITAPTNTFGCRRLTPFETIMWRTRGYVHQILGELDHDAWFSLCRHGPGSTVGHAYDDRSYSAKFLLPIDLTEACLPLWHQYLGWCRPLRVAYDVTYPGVDASKSYRLVRGSKLTTVPKTNEIERVIAKEPTGNMFLQQGLGRLIAQRLRPFGVDLEHQQDLHWNLAYQASITGDLGTIDFSSASDTVGVSLTKWLLPVSWWTAIDAVRCREIQISNDFWMIPSCFASMGNATTFPIETLFFFSLGKAVVSWQGDKSRSLLPDFGNDNVSAFGDDVILPSDACDLYMTVAQKLGFIVNVDKSHTKRESKFRESCGGDFFSGRNVRPHSIEAPRSLTALEYVSWLNIQGNRVIHLLRRALGPNYVYRATALELILNEIVRQNGVLFLVPDDYPDGSGLKLGGDHVRLKQYPFASIFTDKHGTCTFRCIMPVDDGKGRARIRPFYLWQTLLREPVSSLSLTLDPPVKLCGLDREMGNESLVVTSNTSCSFSSYLGTLYEM